MPRKKTVKKIPTEPQTDLKEIISARYRHKSKAIFWMWSGVTAFAVIILILWSWSLKLRASFFNWKDLGEAKIITQTQTDWDRLFDQTKENELQEQLTKLQLKSILEQITQTAPTTSVTTTNP